MVLLDSFASSPVLHTCVSLAQLRCAAQTKFLTLEFRQLLCLSKAVDCPDFLQWDLRSLYPYLYTSVSIPLGVGGWAEITLVWLVIFVLLSLLSVECTIGTIFWGNPPVFKSACKTVHVHVPILFYFTECSRQ